MMEAFHYMVSDLYAGCQTVSMRTATIGTTAYFAGGTGGVANDVCS
ncbi:MAG: hypothetical protein IPL12_22880 [Bacteroidetes bacterium]|nr:hypothetical protein [Bacteroidota bacterium]